MFKAKIVKDLVERRKMLWREWVKLKDGAEKKKKWEEFKEARREVREKVGELKKKDWEKVGRELEESFEENKKVFWAHIKRLNGKSGQSGTGPVKDKEGKLVVDQKGKNGVWKGYFEGLGEVGDESEKFDEEFRNQVEREVAGMAARSCREESNEELDKIIEEGEVKIALGEMKNGKAAGEDGILTELLKGGGEVMVKWLTMLFNKAWREECIPVEWGRGMIVPLFKGGDKTDCGNYRGIALLSIVGKVFTRVINGRLMPFMEREELVEEQGGFRNGRGCMDILYTWAEVVRGRRGAGMKTYCAFIDVKKAYDRVWRDGLWKRLWESGVRGKMWRVVRGMYEVVSSCVMVDGDTTEWFDTLMGVRQGCVISPVLFSTFINGFAKELINSGVGGVDVAGENLRLLMFADDIVMFAEDEGGLQDMLDVLAEYSKKWRFEINVGKSKVMVCGSKKMLKEEHGKWMYGGEEIGRVTEYKYVGVIVNEEGNWKDAIRKVVEKGKKLSRELEGWLGRHWEVGPRIKLDVWKSTVGAVLRYGSEVWFADVREEIELERVQLKIIKQVLRLNRSTVDEFVRGEVD